MSSEKQTMSMTDAMLAAYREKKMCRPFMWRKKALRLEEFYAGALWVQFPVPCTGFYKLPEVALIPTLPECVGPWEVVSEKQVTEECASS